MTNTYTPAAITGKQMVFLTKLLDDATTLLDRKYGITMIPDVEAGAAVQAMRNRMDDMTKLEASKAIGQAMDNNQLLRDEVAALETEHGVPPVQTPAPEFVTETGIYRVGDRIFKVLPSRSSDRHYAKELTGFHWDDKLPVADEKGANLKFVYAPGAMRLIRSEHRVPLDFERAFGQLTGSCIDCGKLLTDPKSIDYGKGPVCSDNYTH